jgi:MFS family permease
MSTLATRSGRTLPLLCLCCGCWAFGFGLECPLASRWLQDSGRAAAFIGFNTGTHFLGCVLMGAAAPFIIRRAGRGGIVVGLLLSGVAVAAFPWASGAIGWFSLRLLAGAGGALTMISLETFINLNAAPDHRARDFALYACSVGIGFALGSFWGLHLFAMGPHLSFALGGGVTLAAIPVLALLPPFPAPPPDSPTARAPRPPILSIGSSWCQGFLEAGLLSMLPLYLRAVGMSDGAAGTLIGSILVGVLICQVPIGGLADLLGRERALIACFIIVAVGLALVPGTEHSFGRLAWLFIIGVCSGAFYPLGLALLGERLTPAQLPRANAWFMSVNSLGSMAGPLISGPLMELYGPQAMFWTGEAVVAAALAAWLLARLYRRPLARFIRAKSLALIAKGPIGGAKTSS